ncbi:ABC transporter ATP-binding protein [soil metagenome]
MSSVISIENLGKRYSLGVFDRKAFTRGLKQGLRKMVGRAEKTEPKPGQEIWALKDINLEIREGEILGIIGRNGSGKSTLLKILSRITSPTTGSARVRGTVASLLEVGTGFHPELTGRENIYLNGSILGMSTGEINRKLDQIIDFAGVEQFLDTPVKRYSSGMRIRLAFAVAAHLEPDILIVDEVLSVGDAGFQQKCLGRIGKVAGQGRTVLFVSHHAAAVENLCTRGVVLQKGQIVYQGTQTEALDFYSQSFGTGVASLRDRIDHSGNGKIRVVEVELLRNGISSKVFPSGGAVEIRFYYENHSSVPYNNLSVEVSIRTHFDAPVFSHSNRATGDSFGDIGKKGYFSLVIPRLPLPSGNFRLSYYVRSGTAAEYHDGLQDAVELQIEGGDFFGTGHAPAVSAGVCLVDGQWEIRQAS